jgi:hypothetical protein
MKIRIIKIDKLPISKIIIRLIIVKVLIDRDNRLLTIKRKHY